MARGRSTYPGGPRRPDFEPEDGPGRAPRLERVQDMEARAGQRSQDRGRRRRAKRVWAGLAAAVALAGAAGFLLGVRSHSSPEEMTAARNAATAAQARAEASTEVNRVLMELWRMEDVEKQATPP